MTAPWWRDDFLGVGPRGLTLDGHAVADLAEARGTPLYAYSRRAAAARVRQIRDTGVVDRVWYALKANRHAPLVEAIRAEGAGIDACSPRELRWALDHACRPDEVSVTLGMPSERDLDALVASGCHVNLDSFSALRRWRRWCDRPVGVRVDPGVEVGYGRDPKVTYGNTKFGVRLEDLERALGEFDVDTLHVHFGWGMQEADLPRFEAGIARLATFAHRVGTVNVGGGLGARQRAEDRPLPLDAWAEVLRRHLNGVQIACEPGTFVVARAGVLVCEVTTVERKGDVTWVGLDAGHNVNVYAAHYGIPMEIVPVDRPDARPTTRYHVAGNLNEAGDVFARDRMLPALEEGQRVALLPAGAYGASMASDHCLRGWAGEVAV